MPTLIRWTEVSKLVPFSNETARRMEKRGLFPRRIKLDPEGHMQAAAYWAERDIKAWLEKHTSQIG